MTISVPTDGEFFEWGDSIPYTVTVTDPEDGAAVECSRVTVTFVLVHDQHGHGEASQTGGGFGLINWVEFRGPGV